MRNQFPPSDKCDFCVRKATKQSDDGADLCNKCWKGLVTKCAGCPGANFAIKIGVNEHACRISRSTMASKV